HAGDALVELGLEEPERKVLHLPLQLEDAEPVRQRRIDVEALARIGRALGMRALLLLAGEPAQRLRAAREAYQHHAHILDHAEDHLAQHLVLFDWARARRKAQLVEPFDTAREVGDLVAELLADLVQLDVLWRGEQQSCHASGPVELDRRQVGRQSQGMRPGRLAGREQLPRVDRFGELERAREAHPLGRREPLGERLERAGGALRMQLDYGDHALFYGPWAGSPNGAAAACLPGTGWTTRSGSARRARSRSCRARRSCASSPCSSSPRRISSAPMS